MPLGRDSLAVIAIVLATAFLAVPAHAATFTVNNPGDQGDALPGDGKCDSDTQGCTLRAATEEAGPSAIDPSNTINVPAGTYNLFNGPLTLSRTTTIVGAGARTTLIRQMGRLAARVFEIGSGTTTIRQVTMSGGTADSTNGFFGGNLHAQGGATVTVEDSTVTGGNGSSGGGLSNEGGTMTVRRSTVAGNNALTGGGDGGGIQNTSGRTAGRLTVENSTISGNEARLAGGIISSGNAATSVTISDSTIAGNNAKDRTDLPNGGGMSILDGTATVVRSIVANNTSIAMTTPNCASDPVGAIPGTISSGGNNLESGTDCAFKAGGDLQSSNPQLGALANNGGQTDTRAIPVTSPAHDVYTAACIATDQRGISRPQGPACDIGAFELLDTTPPDTTITGGPAGPTNTATPAFTFTSTEPGAGSSFQCRVDTAAFATCTSPHTTAALSDGEHTFEVRATDAVGNVDQTPASRTFTIKRTSPPATSPDTAITLAPRVFTRDRTPTFTFTSNLAGATFECSLDGGPFTPCSSPFSTNRALGAGRHEFRVRARNAAGTVDPSPAAAVFAIPAKLSDLPPPKLGRTFNVEPVGDGDVFVSEAGGAGAARARASAKVPGVKGRNFIPLREARQLRVGSFLDTRRGRVRLLTARNAKGATQSGEFFNGVFQTLQSRQRSESRQRSAQGLTELRLKGSSFRSCRSSGKKATVARRRASRRRIRRLSGNAKGRFRTRGRYSAATVRGTAWTVTDRCDGTLTKVSRGKVAVRDFRRRKNILVRRGKSYLARARR